MGFQNSIQLKMKKATKEKKEIDTKKEARRHSET